MLFTVAHSIILAMKSQGFHKLKLPDTPGVYFFLGRNKKILYIGKATSLRDRVASYFKNDLADARGPLIVQMVEETVSIDFRATDSVLEAILLEADLIKKFQPYFNTKEKSDKSFNCVVITDEDFPRVLIVRKKDIDFSSLKIDNCLPAPQGGAGKLKIIFGPFPSGSQLKDALKIIRKIFPFRDRCNPPSHSDVLENIRIRNKACFNRQIGLCPGVCTGEISKKDYARTIQNLKLFFSGKKGQILKNLKREMNDAVKLQNFERAGEIKKTLFSLEHIQDIALIKSEKISTTDYLLPTSYRIEAYDIAHISGTDVVGAMVVLEDGMPEKSDYRKFKIKGGFGNNDVASLKEVIDRRLAHDEWLLPSLFVADGGASQKEMIEKALQALGVSIPVVAVTKNERHRPEKILGDNALIKAHERAILLANNEAHRFAIGFHRKRRMSNWGF